MPQITSKTTPDLEVAKKREVNRPEAAGTENLVEQAPAVGPAVQRAAVQPNRLNARDLMAIQRVAGNQATTAMLKRAGAGAASRVGVQRETAAREPAAEEEEIQTKPLASINSMLQREAASEEEEIQTRPLPQHGGAQIQRGFSDWFSKGKGNASQGTVSEGKNVATTAVTGTSVYTGTKSALEAINGTREAGTAVFLGALQQFADVIMGWGIPGLLMLCKKVYDLIKTGSEVDALEKAKDSLEKKKAASQNGLPESEENLLEATQHGYGKVRRRFWEGVYNVISSAVKTIAHFITLLSGGTAAMVTELIAFGMVVVDGIVTLFHKAKGFFKWLMDKRGTHRKQSAERMVTSALANDRTALDLLVTLDPMGTLGREKRAMKFGYGPPPEPTNADEMLDLLRTLVHNTKMYGTLDDFKEDVAVKLKSTT